MTAQLTVLNSMAGPNLATALDQHVAWNIEVVDLKEAILGHSLSDLSETEARRAGEMIAERNLSVYCFSTNLAGSDIAEGEAAFRSRHLAALEPILRNARVLCPRLIRLLAAGSSKPLPDAARMPYLQSELGWVFQVYRELIDTIEAAGFVATIENEVDNCIWARPHHVVEFFQILDRPRVTLTWDVQNMWQMGTFPSLEVYHQLQPLIGYVHLKGGQSDDGDRLAWRSTLEEASWPVVEIVSSVLADGVSPVICLNSPHGALRPDSGDEPTAAADLQFLRATFPGLQ